jgi:hypothetical protein
MDPPRRPPPSGPPHAATSPSGPPVCSSLPPAAPSPQPATHCPQTQRTPPPTHPPAAHHPRQRTPREPTPAHPHRAASPSSAPLPIHPVSSLHSRQRSYRANQLQSAEYKSLALQFLHPSSSGEARLCLPVAQPYLCLNSLTSATRRSTTIAAITNFTERPPQHPGPVHRAAQRIPRFPICHLRCAAQPTRLHRPSATKDETSIFSAFRRKASERVASCPFSNTTSLFHIQFPCHD